MTFPLVADGWGLDRGLAAMFCRAKRGETVSYMAGQAQVRGERWGCLLCRVLAVIVERDHCARTIDPAAEATPLGASYRAGAALFAVALVMSFGSYEAWHLVFAAWRAVMG